MVPTLILFNKIIEIAELSYILKYCNHGEGGENLLL